MKYVPVNVPYHVNESLKQALSVAAELELLLSEGNLPYFCNYFFQIGVPKK